MEKPVLFWFYALYLSCKDDMYTAVLYFNPPPPQSSRLDWPWPSTVNVSVSTLVK